MKSDAEKRWDSIYKNGNGYNWVEPHAELQQDVKMLKASGCERVLDIGCGYGRHIAFLSERGFELYGMDISSESIKLLSKRLDGVCDALLVQHDMLSTPFPFEDRYFACVLAFQVIHHGTSSDIAGTIREIRRLLVEDGLIIATVPIEHQAIAKKFREIEPGTLVPLDGPELGIPHHYFDAEEIYKHFKGFRIEKMLIDEWRHWYIVARAKGEK